MTTATASLDEAIALASTMHAGQLDKGGRPYLGHLERVANMVRLSGGDWVQEMAAWLHDSIEDTGATGAQLLAAGIPGIVLNIVLAMTHPEGEPNVDYWMRVRSYEPARLVKLCDIYDNLDPSRMCYLDQPTQDRLRSKYAMALVALVG